MSVDIDSLIIGCHIRVNGKRAKVISVESTGIVGCRADDDWLKVTSDDIEPIPITPDLLKELGFEREMRFACGKAFKMKCGEMWIGVSAISKGFWRIEAMDDTYNYGNCTVRYLHEAELFLALHNLELNIM